jgi:hypothetical protein
MAARRLALALLALVVLAALSPADAQDFAFGAVTKTVSLGSTKPPVSNRGVAGALCVSGTVTLGATGFVTTSNQSTCDGATFVNSTGALTIEPDGLVLGAVGGDAIVGQLLPNGHGFVGATTFNTSVVGGFGLTVLVEPGTTTFTQGDLTGTWRVKALRGGVLPAGSTTSGAFGTITFDSAGQVTAENLTEFPSLTADSVFGGALSIDATGHISGLVISGTHPPPDFRSVTAVMAPDKTFVAGITTIGPPASLNESGMFFLQRSPTVAYSTADLAGTWQFVGMQARGNDSSTGSWMLGALALSATGGVLNGSFTDAFANTATVVAGSFGITSAGFIAGTLDLSTGDEVMIQATMFQDKHQIIGVADTSLVNPETVGLFSMFKPGPLTLPAASTVQFHTATAKVTEGGTVVIQVDRGGATTTNVTVDYAAVAGTAAPGDFTPVSGTLSIASGHTTASFNVPTFPNTVADGDRTVILTLGNPTNGATLGTRSTQTLTIADDDSLVQFSQSVFTTKEGTAGVITVTRSGGLAFPASVGYNVSGLDARPGVDFTPASGTLSFAANQAAKTFSVTTIPNTLVDGNRSALLTLSTPSTNSSSVSVLGPQATALLTILDDDQGGVVKLGSAAYSAKESTSLAVTILRTAVGSGPLASNVSVSYATVNGNASAGVNYTATTGTVTFGAGETSKTVPIPILRDNVVTGPLTFTFALGSPTGGGTLGSPAAATVTIGDVDLGGVVVLSAKTYSVIENAGNVSVTLTRSGGAAANASVLLTISNGTALAGTDYTNVSQRVTFAAGQASTKVVIPIINNTLPDGDRTFTVALSAPQGGAGLGTPVSAVVTILDDESAVQFTSTAFSTQEGSPGVITLARTGAMFTTVTVPVNVSGITAVPGVDFTTLSAIATFPVNAKLATVQILTRDNTILDGSRTALLTLGAPTGGAQLGANSSAVLTITDNEDAGLLALDKAAYSGVEGQVVTIGITRKASRPGTNLVGNVSVGYATVSGNAAPAPPSTPPPAPSRSASATPRPSSSPSRCGRTRSSRGRRSSPSRSAARRTAAPSARRPPRPCPSPTTTRAAPSS